MERELFGRGGDGDVKNVCGSGAEHVRHIKESKMKMNRPATG
jgi:hypothetical protein